MLTIGQLAAQAGVSTKAIRVYHAKGLLPEPERDGSGYRRYGAQAVIDLARIVTLARAGVPLARIPDVLNADDAAEQIDRIDAELRDHIRSLRQRRIRLRDLDRPDRLCLPREATEYLDRLRGIGLSERYEHAARDGWILGFAVAPDITRTVLRSHATLLDDDEYIAMLRTHDAAYDWEPDDPRLDHLAETSAKLAQRMVIPSDLDDFRGVAPEIVDLLTAHQSVGSPAWKRLDELTSQRIAGLRADDADPASHSRHGRGGHDSGGGLDDRG
ncbi:MerR family transcriptional regulator [Gordonia sp. FQ]|uniref:MerR family transcriptional regulator n=1 Tax=Gordonia sp. FQ TaxID=3446634 RepID=UPI003F869246